MTPAEIMAAQADVFIMSCALYEAGEATVLSDEKFDAHCKRLLRWWDDLPESFRARVSRENLTAGTAVGLTFTDAELQAGREWRLRVHGC